MNSSLTAKRSFLPPGFRVEYQAAVESKEIYLPKLVDSLLRHLIAPLVLHCSPIVNLKGRDQRNLINPDIPAALLPTADEFCFVAGALTRTAKSGSSDQEFSIAVNSRFIENEKTLHMLHVAETERTGFPEAVPVEQTGWLPALHLKQFRLGFDLFENRFLSSLIGLVPTVSQTLLIEADERTCHISIVAEGLKSKDTLPLQASKIWSGVRTSLQDTLAFDLQGDYKRQLQGLS